MNGGRRMGVVVYPHTLEIGGSQLNAVELAAAVRDRGHAVSVYGRDGALVDYVRQLGLPFRRAASSRISPSPSVARDLRTLSGRTDVDIVHGYEWPPILEAYAAGGPSQAPRAVGTVMSMAVADFVPGTVPLAVGTERIRRETAARRPGPVHLLEPPVDTELNRPGAGKDAEGTVPNRRGGRARIAVVSRLAEQLKLEGILTAIRVVDELSHRRPVELLIVGDGPAGAEVRAAADVVNRRHEEPLVLVTGVLRDPRAAYDSADICLGMGGSALRAMSFAKPLVVQGEGGFFQVLTEATLATFLEQGWYGTDQLDRTRATERLVRLVEDLLGDRDRLQELGRFSRQTAVDRFSLQAAARRQEEIYLAALDGHRRPRRELVAAARSGSGLVGYKLGRRLSRLRGTAATDDFNAKPV